MNIVHCSLADADHRKKRRYYAHVLHRPDCICVCRAFANLPDEFALAILLHELGHLIDPEEENERAVDRLASKAFGIPISRVDSKYGSNLEHISARNVERAARVIARRLG